MFPQNVIKRHIRNIRSDKSCDNLIRYDPRISISSLRFNPSSCDIWHPNCWGVSGSIDDRKNEFDQITKGVRRSLFSQGLPNLSFQHFSSHFSSTTTAWATFNKLYEARLSIEYSIHVLNDIRVYFELGWWFFKYFTLTHVMPIYRQSGVIFRPHLVNIYQVNFLFLHTKPNFQVQMSSKILWTFYSTIEMAFERLPQSHSF